MIADITTTTTQTFNIDDFQFTPTGFSTTVALEDVNFQAWQKIGEFIRLTNVASQWWWGDWLNLGEDVFGEKSSQALEITKWDETTLRVYAWVCRNVPPDKRLTGTSFSHYLLLAKLPPKKQLHWAKKVVEHQWSQRQLRQALRNSNENAIKMQPCVLVRCEDETEVEQVEAWATQNKLDTDVVERVRKG